MFSSVPDEDPGLFITELIRFSNQAALLKTERRSHEQNEAPQTLVDSDSFVYVDREAIETLTNAPPLMPLNDRDLKVLETFFKRNGIKEIETDVIRSLGLLQPEPCWDDDPMEIKFLKEYL